MQRFSFNRTQTASNKTPRRINRNLIFNLIRTKQPISRADLARVSGLQRSTISLIVEDLIAEGWIVEGAVGHLPRGRRPTFLEINSRRAIIALDIHPSQTTIAVTDLAGRIITQQIVLVPDGATKALNAIVNAIRKLLAAHEDLSFDGIGISLPGRADLNLQKLIFAPNLNWPVLSLKSKMERATGLRVKMDNVANACALSEVWFGSSDGLHDLVVVNVSEGIGTGIFANGQLLRGESGLAGEFGHVQLDADGPQCACGNRGCWEVLASNRAAVAAYAQLTGTQPITFDALLKLSQKGDKHAITALTRMAENLGRGIRTICVALAPKEIVVVGDITTVWHSFGSIIEAQMKKNAFTKPPILRPAYDGATARLRSAVALVLGDDSISSDQ
ncbi:ROK family protein [Granulicella sp. 5B5]|uniref:ROK family transcriptional regulator n=1 Tax=Granulicella sp. 5B5 TaxID=1617967 RepID=UPI0015F69A14|nr:ROK family transcriptional regulator [Granulicella sp. 5B5]QMV19441.1 ROK family protein [Granulicella sp. 5B5]